MSPFQTTAPAPGCYVIHSDQFRNSVIAPQDEHVRGGAVVLHHAGTHPSQAQKWIIARGTQDGFTTLKNVYTGTYLSVDANLKFVGSIKPYDWVVVKVDARRYMMHWKPDIHNVDVEASNGHDGAALNLGAFDNSGRFFWDFQATTT